MPIAITKPTMLPPQEILTTAIAEHDFQNQETGQSEDIINKAFAALDTPNSIPFYDPASTPPLTVCRFRCMLQDTGYPLEVYMPPGGSSPGQEDLYGNAVDWSRLKERWVGWGVEVPGEQSWVKEELCGPVAIHEQLANLEITSSQQKPMLPELPDSVHGKYPIPGLGGNYAGLLLKIYDAETSYQAASAYTFTGILSSSSLPASDDQEDDSTMTQTVPTLHVLSSPYESYPLRSAPIAAEGNAERDEVVAYLRSAFAQEDTLAAEFLLLALTASVTTRVPGGPPLGTLSLNLLIPKEAPANNGIFKRMTDVVESVNPLVTPVELSIDLLSNKPFFPYSQDASSSIGLQSGVLQLVPSTIVLLNEDTLQPGDLKDRAVKNLKAMMGVVKGQKLRYEFPFVGEDFGMDVDLGIVLVGQGKSFMPVDLHVPLLSGPESPTLSEVDESKLNGIRRYISESRAAASSLEIPDDVAEHIQSEFVRLRKEAGDDSKAVGEEDLKRWMRIGRLLALSYADRRFTKEVWDRVLAMDKERISRLESR